MKQRGFVEEYSWKWRYCPFCYGRLGMWAFFGRRRKKVCKCGECGRRIDERFMKW